MTERQEQDEALAESPDGPLGRLYSTLDELFIELTAAGMASATMIGNIDPVAVLHDALIVHARIYKALGQVVQCMKEAEEAGRDVSKALWDWLSRGRREERARKVGMLASLGYSGRPDEEVLVLLRGDLRRYLGLAKARDKRIAQRQQAAQWNRAEWRAMAAAAWRDDTQQKRDVVAQAIRDELAKRPGASIRNLPSIVTIRNTIKGVRDTVVTNMARASSRKPQ